MNDRHEQRENVRGPKGKRQEILPFRSRMLRPALAAIAVIIAGAIVAVSAVSPSPAAASSTRLPRIMERLDAAPIGSRGCAGIAPSGELVYVSSGEVVATENGTLWQCVNGQWVTF